MIGKYISNIKVYLSVFLLLLAATAIFLMGGCGITGEKTLKNAGNYVDISASEVYKIIAKDKGYYFILDVRDLEEFEDSHIQGATLIPQAEIKNRLDELPKDKPILVYCRSGRRSSEAADILIKSGFQKVFNLLEGIQSWEVMGYPVIKEQKNQNIESTTASDGNEDINTISVDEAYDIFQNSKDYFFIDVRSIDEYADGHIEGAVSISVDNLEKKLNEISKDKSIIIYCNGSGCNRSVRAVKILIENGFNKVYNMGGLGIDEWKDKGYPFVLGY